MPTLIMCRSGDWSPMSISLQTGRPSPWRRKSSNPAPIEPAPDTARTEIAFVEGDLVRRSFEVADRRLPAQERDADHGNQIMANSR